MAEMIRRVGTYLGLVEEDEDYEYLDLTDAEGDTSNVHRLPPRSRAATERRREGPAARDDGGRAPAAERVAAPPAAASAAGPEGSMEAAPLSHVVVTSPETFNEVEEVGERFRADVPVIMNLAAASETTAKRILDFASGLVFARDGRIERIGERVFLLTPAGLEVSTEERRRLRERGFFNQV